MVTAIDADSDGPATLHAERGRGGRQPLRAGRADRDAGGRRDRRAAVLPAQFLHRRLDLLVRRGFDRLAGRSEDGAFYLTQATGGGKTRSLIALGLLASEPGLRREVVPEIASGAAFGAARVVVFSGHQNPETLLWGHIAEQLGRGQVMAPFRRAGAKTPGIDEWVTALGTEPVLILLDELPSYLQMARGEPVG
ncbi:MAG: hypothetical protein ACREFN_19885, partial [Acetobacteraceae bacterium]